MIRGSERGGGLLKAVVVAALVVLGALFAVGCALAAVFESQGFGGPRDTVPRLGYLLLLALGFVASVVVPAFVWRRLLPESAPALILAFIAAFVGAIPVLGISLA